ncbi:SCAN domain-containing protein 3-like [Amphiura filiformis]|uniref:SCAN domain-containing protein 3-like n=1 Tax=Amphiura filiformis TaxID=82378 RepID=UPI003B20FB02
MDRDVDDYLKSLYYDVSGPGSLGGIERLYRKVKREGKFQLTRRDIENWLLTQDAYTLHKPSRRRFPRNIYFSDGIDQTWQIDLIEFQKLVRYNRGYKFVLTCIDVFSKFAWARSLKDKKGPTVAAALKNIFEEGRQPTQLQSDKGKEFLNKDVQKLFKDKNIHFFTTQNPDTKAAIVERFNRTLKDRIFRYFTRTNSSEYHRILRDAVAGYNSSYHRSIKQSPASVTKDNESTVWKTLYGKYKRSRKPNKQNLLEAGDLVRISVEKLPFRKGYLPQWSEELFVVAKRIDRRVPVYVLKDFYDEEIEGTFYGREIQKVTKDKDGLFKVEKVIRKRKRQGVTEYFVKWLGWPDKFNSWVVDLEDSV